jgi:hypothetical protein
MLSDCVKKAIKEVESWPKADQLILGPTPKRVGKEDPVESTDGVPLNKLGSFQIYRFKRSEAEYINLLEADFDKLSALRAEKKLNFELKDCCCMENRERVPGSYYYYIVVRTLDTTVFVHTWRGSTDVLSIPLDKVSDRAKAIAAMLGGALYTPKPNKDQQRQEARADICRQLREAEKRLLSEAYGIGNLCNLAVEIGLPEDEDVKMVQRVSGLARKVIE